MGKMPSSDKCLNSIVVQKSEGNYKFNEAQVKSILISRYFSSSGFRETFFENKRIYELYKSIEGKISIFLAILISSVLMIFFYNNSLEYVNSISSILLTLIGGFISLIAFSLGALALTLGSINKEEIFLFTELKYTEQKNKLYIEISNIDHLRIYRDITFRFYHSAFYNFIIIIELLMTYIYINLNMDLHIIFNFIVGYFVVYFIVYSLLFNITLVNDCIKMKFTDFMSPSDIKNHKNKSN